METEVPHMIQYERMTTEEALRRAFKDDSRAIGIVIDAKHSDTVRVSLPLSFEVPAKFAKAILADYLNETLKEGR